MKALLLSLAVVLGLVGYAPACDPLVTSDFFVARSRAVVVPTNAAFLRTRSLVSHRGVFVPTQRVVFRDRFVAPRGVSFSLFGPRFSTQTVVLGR